MVIGGSSQTEGGGEFMNPSKENGDEIEIVAQMSDVSHRFLMNLRIGKIF